MKKTRTTAYHPQGDGLVERYNRTLLEMLATCTRDHPASWESHLQKVCFAYNYSEQPTTGYSPSFLMFGREARLPIDFMVGAAPTTPVSPFQYAADLQAQLTAAYRQVREHMAVSHNCQKELYDRRVHGKPFAAGDMVWLHSPQVPVGQSKKLYCPWSGPYRIVTRLSDVTYRICSLNGCPTWRIVHFDRLKPCPMDICTEPAPPHTATVPTTPSPRHVGQEIVITPDLDQCSTAVEPPHPPHTDDNPPRRYPTRPRRPPDFLTV